MNTASRVSDIREAFEAWVTERSRKELWPKNPLERRSDLNYSAIATHYAWKAWKAAIACQGPVMKDAERYLKLRNAPLGVDGVPCVALPKGERSGDYINDDYLDAAVDGMPMGESIEEKIQGVIESHEIAKGVKTDNGEDWENGYAFAVESMLGDLTALIAKANGHE